MPGQGPTNTTTNECCFLFWSPPTCNMRTCPGTGVAGANSANLAIKTDGVSAGLRCLGWQRATILAIRPTSPTLAPAQPWYLAVLVHM